MFFSYICFMKNTESIISKQNMRLIDIVIVSPFLIYASTLKQNPNWVRISLMTLGITTFLYNGIDYLYEKNK
jgi:hypothetical protein